MGKKTWARTRLTTFTRYKPIIIQIKISRASWHPIIVRCQRGHGGQRFLVSLMIYYAIYSKHIYIYSWKLGGVYGGGLWISLDKLWISQWWLCSARNVWRGWCVVIYCKIERYQDLARVAWARLARNKQARTKMQLKSPGIDSLLANAWPMYSR